MRVSTQSKVVGSIGEGMALTFDTTGTAHIMGILSNMYSNAPLAVLREYACNAIDSHVSAGTSRPVEVTLPTAGNPVLVIRDFGLGLSREDIINVYSRYGASTKRDDNDQIGAFGIGAKSAFTVGTQFTVTGIKNGEKTTALFYLDAMGAPRYTLLDPLATTEDNGVTIKVTVDNTNMNVWADEATTLFQTWEPGTVLLNGATPTSLYESATKLSDNLWLDHEAHRSGSAVVMGRVAYEVGYALATRIGNELPYEYRQMPRVCGHLIHVEMGAVDLAPSRESVRDTRRTVAALAKAYLAAGEALTEALQAEYAKAKNPIETISTFHQWATKLKESGINITLPTEVSTKVDVVQATAIFSQQGRSRATVGSLHIDPRMATFLSYLYVTGDEDALNRARRLVGRWRHHHRNTPVVLLDPNTQEGWFSPVAPLNVMTAEDFIAAAKKLAPAVVRETSGAPVYNVRLSVEDGWAAFTLDELVASDYTELIYARGSIPSLLLKHNSVTTPIVVIEGRQSLDAFVKRATKAGVVTLRTADKVLHEIVKAEYDALSGDELQTLANLTGDGWVPWSRRQWLEAVQEEGLHFEGFVDTSSAEHRKAVNEANEKINSFRAHGFEVPEAIQTRMDPRLELLVETRMGDRHNEAKSLLRMLHAAIEAEKSA